jgi:hypothetical protein
VCSLTGEEVVVVLPQLDGALVQLAGALPGLGAQTGPHVLHALLVVGVQEHHDGVPLGVVQPVHRVGRDVQHRVLVLRRGDKKAHVIGCSPIALFVEVKHQQRFKTVQRAGNVVHEALVEGTDRNTHSVDDLLDGVKTNDS